MSKKRKTKKEKILTEARRATSVVETSSMPVYSFSASTQIHKNVSVPVQTLHQHSYAYVLTDIKHTIIITSVLAGFSIISFILIQSHIIRLSIFGY